MLLSAVSVLVVAQSSSEILEGLMNNPVYTKCGVVNYAISSTKINRSLMLTKYWSGKWYHIFLAFIAGNKWCRCVWSIVALYTEGSWFKPRPETIYLEVFLEFLQSLQANAHYSTSNQATPSSITMLSNSLWRFSLVSSDIPVKCHYSISNTIVSQIRQHLQPSPCSLTHYSLITQLF